jgi:hypothetical protein
MKLRKAFFFVSLIFAGATIFAQDASFPKIMYVTSTDGLKVRAEPSLSGDRVDTLLFASRIVVFDRKNQMTIDGITDYWYRIHRDDEKWVFGGYVSENFPKIAPIILGRWDDPSDPSQYYRFHPDRGFAEGTKESDAGVHGTWSLDGNNIILHLTGSGPEVEIDETVEVRLTVIDINNIRLTFPKNRIVFTFPKNRIVELTRSKDLW